MRYSWILLLTLGTSQFCCRATWTKFTSRENLFYSVHHKNRIGYRKEILFYQKLITNFVWMRGGNKIWFSIWTDNESKRRNQIEIKKMKIKLLSVGQISIVQCILRIDDKTDEDEGKIENFVSESFFDCSLWPIRSVWIALNWANKF